MCCTAPAPARAGREPTTGGAGPALSDRKEPALVPTAPTDRPAKASAHAQLRDPRRNGWPRDSQACGRHSPPSPSEEAGPQSQRPGPTPGPGGRPAVESLRPHECGDGVRQSPGQPPRGGTAAVTAGPTPPASASPPGTALRGGSPDLGVGRGARPGPAVGGCDASIFLSSAPGAASHGEAESEETLQLETVRAGPSALPDSVRRSRRQPERAGTHTRKSILRKPRRRHVAGRQRFGNTQEGRPHAGTAAEAHLLGLQVAVPEASGQEREPVAPGWGWGSTALDDYTTVKCIKFYNQQLPVVHSKWIHSAQIRGPDLGL